MSQTRKPTDHVDYLQAQALDVDTLLTVGGIPVPTGSASLTALGGLVPAVDKLPYFTGAASAALADFTAFGRSLVDDANAGAARTTLGAAPLASPTFTGTTTAPEFSASGLTGAVAPTRYAGGTATGAPTTGTFAVGDFVVAQDGVLWVCTVAGTPGTWIPAAPRELGYVEDIANHQITTTSGTGLDIPGMSLTVTVGVRPIIIEWTAHISCPSTGTGVSVFLVDVTAGNVNIGAVANQSAPLLTANNIATATAMRRLAPAPGSRTYKLALISQDGTATVIAWAYTFLPMTFSIREV